MAAEIDSTCKYESGNTSSLVAKEASPSLTAEALRKDSLVQERLFTDLDFLPVIAKLTNEPTLSSTSDGHNGHEVKCDGTVSPSKDETPDQSGSEYERPRNLMVELLYRNQDLLYDFTASVHSEPRGTVRPAEKGDLSDMSPDDVSHIYPLSLHIGLRMQPRLPALRLRNSRTFFDKRVADKRVDENESVAGGRFTGRHKRYLKPGEPIPKIDIFTGYSMSRLLMEHIRVDAVYHSRRPRMLAYELRVGMISERFYQRWLGARSK